MRSLDRIQATLASSRTRTSITPLRITVRDLKTSFGSLVNEQKSLGFNETEGTTADLIAASNAVEDHHPRRSVLGRRSRRRQAFDVAADHAPLRDRVPAHARPAAEQHFLDEVKHFNAPLRVGRRRAVDEAEAESDRSRATATPSRNGSRARTISSRCSTSSATTPQACCPKPTRSSRRRRTAPTAPRARWQPRGRGRVHSSSGSGLAVVLIGLACSWRIGRSITRPLEGLAGAMKRLADGDTSARIPRHRFARRDRRHGAHGRRVPRQYDRARAPCRRPDRNQCGARAARRGDRRDDPAIPHIGRSRRWPGCANPPDAWNSASSGLNDAADAVSSEARAAENSVGAAVGQRHDRCELDRGACGFDRGDRLAGDQIDRRREPRRRRIASAPSTPCRNWAAPRTASAR